MTMYSIGERDMQLSELLKQSLSYTITIVGLHEIKTVIHKKFTYIMHIKNIHTP